MVMKLDYNINGIGIVNADIYKLTESLLMNPKICIESRLKNTNQLGSIRYIHNGAHYNRFEYVLLQISILNFVQKNSEIGLGSKFNFKNWGLEIQNEKYKKITTADIMQSIFLCTNLGHFKETFAANKVWYHLLLNDTYGLRKAFKKALSKESKVIFNKLIEEEDYQKLHLINALFILNRNQNTSIYLQIFEKFVGLAMESSSQDKWVDLYSKIRKVSYITLDSHFSYIPIDIDLQKILFNQKLFMDELLKQNSVLFAILDRLNDLLEDTLYLENNVLLMGTYRSLEIEKRVEEYFKKEDKEDNLLKISDINKLILDTQDSPFFESSEINNQDIPWNMDRNLSITYSIADEKNFPNDVFQKEKEARKKLGKGCYVAFNFNPDYTKYRTVYSIDKNENDKVLMNKCLSIVSYAANEYVVYKDYSESVINNGKMQEVVIKKICTYVFRNLLIKDFYCEFNYRKKLPPFIIERGSKTAAKRLKSYIEKCEEQRLYTKDELHEIKSLYERLNQIDYRGLVIVYAGSLRFIDSNRESKCELDGIILMPGNKNGYLNVVEAKNYNVKSQRISEAKKQLTKRFSPLIKPELSNMNEPQEINSYGAYLELY